MRKIEYKTSIALACLGIEKLSAYKFALLVGRNKSKGEYHMRYTPADVRTARYRNVDMDVPDFGTPTSLPLFDPGKPPPVIVTRMTKGGVGKTSTSVNLAAAMAMMGYRILLIDADPQASASNLLLGEEYSAPVKHHIGEFLKEPPNKPSPMLVDAIVPVYDGGFLDIIPSDIRLASTDANLTSEIGYHERAHRFFLRNADYLAQKYDAIIVDTAPGTTPISHAFTFAAKTAGKVLVVVEAVGDCLLALQVLSDNLDEFKAATNAQIGIHIVINKYSPNLKHGKDNLGLLYENYSRLINQIIIPQYSGFSRQMNVESGESKPLVESQPTSTGAVHMFQVAKSLILEFGICLPGLTPDGRNA